jgi:hypothetical protein
MLSIKVQKCVHVQNSELCLDEGMIPWRAWLKFRTHEPGKVVSYVRFEVLMAVTMKNTVFWDVIEDCLCIGEVYCPNIQG